MHACSLVICSRNREPGLGSKISTTQFQIWVITTWFSIAILILQNTTNFDLYLHLFTTLNSLVGLMYFRLHIHQLPRSISTNIVSCDATTPQAVFFVTYLGQMAFETGSVYPVPKSGNAAHH